MSKLFKGKLTIVGFFSIKKLFFEKRFKITIKYLGNFFNLYYFLEFMQS